MKTIQLKVSSLEVFFEMFEKVLMDEQDKCLSNFSVPEFDVIEFRKSKQ